MHSHRQTHTQAHRVCLQSKHLIKANNGGLLYLYELIAVWFAAVA